MTVLFEPKKIGKMEVKNRFVRSAVCENMATESGDVTNQLVSTINTLAKGEIGLVIPGFMYVHPLGRATRFQTGIYSDAQVTGLKKISDAVHREGGKVAFQLAHAGLQTDKKLIGSIPKAPSKSVKDPTSMSKPEEMNEDDIHQTIEAFREAARRAVEAETDAIQFHAAHGYLINQFISPFYNRREDNWGGSDEKRFKYLKELITAVKKVIPADMPLLIKLNINDFTKKEGITPPLAVKYAEWLKDLGIDALEISCGSSHFAMFDMCRGDVPVQEITQFLPRVIRPFARKMFNNMVGKYDLQEAYNLEAAKLIKPVLGKIPLMLVGGFRSLSVMEEVVNQNYADFISIARPFVREPSLVKGFKNGTQDKVKCVSCNRCLAALPNDLPVLCYVNKFPEK